MSLALRPPQELSSDALSLGGFEHMGAASYHLAIQPQLEHDPSHTPARRGGAPATGLPPDLTAYAPQQGQSALARI